MPVINGLTDDSHPCQVMADILTFEEHRGPVAGRTFAWTGDGNNVLHSLAPGLRALRLQLERCDARGQRAAADNMSSGRALMAARCVIDALAR